MVYAVPTHRLGQELLARAKKEVERRGANIKVAIWRGREADDPEAPGEKKCRDLDAVVQPVGGDPEKLVCRQVVGMTICECPFYEVCGYQRQRRQEPPPSSPSSKPGPSASWLGGSEGIPKSRWRNQGV